MLLILALVFAGLSLVVLIVGGVLTLALSGQTRRRSGPEVGAEMMADRLDRNTEGHITAQRTAFVGKAAAVERQATVDFGELKQQIAAGQCVSVLPALLAIGGFVGLLFFGAIAAVVGIPNRLIGGAVAVVILYALVRMGIAFVRA
jgi:hypothetical protein